MTDFKLAARTRTLVQTAVLAAALVALASPQVDAAERVVLGEYFTNVY